LSIFIHFVKNAQKWRFLKNHFQTLRRTTAASNRWILACDAALESFDLVFQDGNMFQVFAHIRHTPGTRATEWIFACF